jgi:hypothetical protein
MGLKTILRKPKKEKAPSSDVKKLKLLITVINKNKTEFYLDFLGGFDCNFQMSVPAKGTAATETLRLLGLEDTDKSVIFSVIKEENAETVLQGLDDKFHSLRGGKGIAFTTPLTSVIGVAIYRFLSDNRTPVKEENKNE